MRRWFALMVLVTASLGWVGVVAPAQAKAPGPIGRILFVRDTRSCDDCNLTTVNPDGTHRASIPGGSIARWSPDGTRIAMVAEADDGRLTTMLVDPDGSDATLFDIPDPTRNVACIVWVPDGSRLLCEVWDDVHPHRAHGVFSVDATNGQDLVRLTTSPVGGHDIPADTSPDGTRILFLREDSTRRHRQLSLWVANADGTNEEALTGPLPHSACCQASWSPDGSLVLFASKGQLRTIAPDGTGAATLELDTGEGFAYAYQPGWSPDGTRIVFSLYLDATRRVDLYTVSADGADLVRLTDSRSPEEFSDWGPHPVATDA